MGCVGVAALKNCLEPLFTKSADDEITLTIHPNNASINADVLTCRQRWSDDLAMEGYGRTGECGLGRHACGLMSTASWPDAAQRANACVVLRRACRQRVPAQAAAYGPHR